MKKYIQVQVNNIDDSEQEKLIAVLDDYGATGFEQNESNLIVYFNEPDFNNIELQTLLEAYEIEIREMVDQNWNEVWESSFQPILIDRFCAVRAAFHEAIENVEHEIIITPKMSFGTGHHATTFMMLQQMQGIDFKDKTVFDFGTGTGVLAILAEKLGAASVTAIDVDDWSIDNASENIVVNQCSKIQLNKSSEIPQQQFDVILANINRNVIVQHFDEIAKAAKVGSSIMISGLLTTDENDIVKEANMRNIKHIKQSSKNNWVCLLFSK